MAWASRFRRGDLVLLGRSDGGSVAFGGAVVGLQGPVRLALGFETPAGGRPDLTDLAIEGGLRVDGREVRLLRATVDGLVVDGEPWSAEPVPLGHALEQLVELLSDVEAEARAIPDGELVVRFGSGLGVSGLEVSIPPGQVLTVQGATVGGARALRLSSPLVVSVQGATIRLGNEQLRWLSSLARVCVHRATLHPDGRVHLEGDARPGLDRAVRGGLQHASVRLSRLVRSSPRFARVRAFLS